MVEGRVFVIYTDHKPLAFAFKQKSDKCTPRQFRHLDLIGQYTTDIRHISGSDNIIADALSRIEPISRGIDFAALAEEQKTDVELKELQRNGTSLILKMVQLPGTDTFLLCDVSTSRVRPFIGRSFSTPYINFHIQEYEQLPN